MNLYKRDLKDQIKNNIHIRTKKTKITWIEIKIDNFKI